jgi:hypothetical protein
MSGGSGQSRRFRVRFAILCISVFLCAACPDAWSLDKESAHFIYYYEAQDSSVVDTIASRLEGSYDRITGDLLLTMTTKTKVHIYPTLQDFHNAIGQPNAPDWLVGTGFIEIYAVSPLNPGPDHSYDEMVNNVFVHEFTHVCLAKVNTNLPIWLNEGFALYEGGPYYSKESVVSAYNNLGRIPSLDELASSYDNFSNLGGYPFSLTITRFAIGTFGMDSMRQFIHHPDNFTVFAGLSKSEFQDEWFDYVRVNYLGIDAVSDKSGQASACTFKLEQGYPNPFNPSAVVSYQLPASALVTLKVYNILGKEIAVLASENERSGRHSAAFHAGDLPSGVYFCKLVANTTDGRKFASTNKLVLIK